ncbi:hypothetical protein B5X24_HaOG203249 [Helicoverpa armigera]|uniref:Uncharacterized protein n=1 Tax=Helicoverpa armigera TaxID=29058 RepID=A0A2W1BXX4_HELAM|nr:hypothetical protein B5X24_HaOG203249 [Helicoverpa armigera]
MVAKIWMTSQILVYFRPCEPPSPDTAPIVRPAPVAPYCHCDAHSYSPRVEQYKQLLEKEQKLCQDYEQLRKQLLNLHQYVCPARSEYGQISPA